MMCEDFATTAVMEDKQGLKTLQQKTCKCTFSLKEVVDLRGRLQGMKPVSMKLEFGFGSPLDLILTGDKPSLLQMYSGNRKLSYGPQTTMVI